MGRSNRSFILRWAERLFWIVSISALGLWVFESSQGPVYQSYANWSFVRTLNGKTVSTRDFAFYLLGWGEALAPPSVARPPLQRPTTVAPVFGRLEIPSIDLSVIFEEGIDARTLSRGVGHIPNTALPGSSGNVGLAAHRDTYFRRLQELHAGDVVVIRTLAATYQYAVSGIEIVDPSDVDVLNDVGSPMLTLVTCYPFVYVGAAPKRYVVRANQTS